MAVWRTAMLLSVRRASPANPVWCCRLIVYRMLSAPSQRLVYGAQTRLAARVKLFDVWLPRIRRSPFKDLFTLSRATGAETLRCSNGSTLALLSTDESAGHGETVDLGILDECWSLDAAC